MLLGGSTSSLATTRALFRNNLVPLRILGRSESLKMASSRGSDRNLRLRVEVEDWTDSDENEPPQTEKEPPAKRKRLSLPKKGRDNGPSFLSIAEEAALSEKCVPKTPR